MKNRGPAYQYYPDKYQAGTKHLSYLANTIYRDILDWMWLHSKSGHTIPNDVTFIASVTGRPLEDVKTAMQEIMRPGFELLKKTHPKTNAKLSNWGLKKETQKQCSRATQAKAAAKVRWNKGLTAKKNNADALQTHMRTVCPPTPTPTPTPIEEEGNAPPSQKKWNWDIPVKQYRTHAGLNSGKWQWDAEKLQDWQQKMNYTFPHALAIFEAASMKPEYAGRAFTVADILKKLHKPTTTNAPSKPKTPEEMEEAAQRIQEHNRQRAAEAEQRRKLLGAGRDKTDAS